LLPAYSFEISPLEAGVRATESARKAIEIDPGNAEAFMALGNVQFNINLETLASRENFEKAYQLAPNNINVVNMYGDFLRLSGDFDKAMQIELKAIELDPLAAVHYSDLTFLFLNLNRIEEAYEQSLIATRLQPDSVDRHESLIISLIHLGKYEQAIETIQMVEEKLNAAGGYISHWHALLYYQQGDREKLRAILNQRLEVADNSRDSSSYTDTAFYTLWLDGVEAALPFLQKAYEKREFLLVDLQYFYLPERISDDPLWIAFWQQPGLAELIETRREFGPFENVGNWRDPLTP
jgi:tetratricopeptide (TPR) repeat protein